MAKVKVSVNVTSKTNSSVMTFNNTSELLGFLARTPKAKVQPDRSIKLG